MKEIWLEREPHLDDYFKTDWTPLWCILGVVVFCIFLIYLFA
jgi:hypothetical protein